MFSLQGDIYAQHSQMHSSTYSHSDKSKTLLHQIEATKETLKIMNIEKQEH